MVGKQSIRNTISTPVGTSNTLFVAIGNSTGDLYIARYFHDPKPQKIQESRERMFLQDLKHLSEREAARYSHCRGISHFMSTTPRATISRCSDYLVGESASSSACEADELFATTATDLDFRQEISLGVDFGEYHSRYEIKHKEIICGASTPASQASQQKPQASHLTEDSLQKFPSSPPLRRLEAGSSVSTTCFGRTIRSPPLFLGSVPSPYNSRFNVVSQGEKHKEIVETSAVTTLSPTALQRQLTPQGVYPLFKFDDYVGGTESSVPPGQVGLDPQTTLSAKSSILEEPLFLIPTSEKPVSAGWKPVSIPFMPLDSVGWNFSSIFGHLTSEERPKDHLLPTGTRNTVKSEHPDINPMAEDETKGLLNFSQPPERSQTKMQPRESLDELT
ncbi:hypothetical protein TWF106_006473 [Orbilia oligospora]|uniref:Uncharacterized protein n=1 Tax=Orbilia oligospora TaxID=2813651 RepID=A0A7C8Q3D2_ORBOL|nr:hypothetical protein TWF788_008218 [Orbilia oligospora]KAF3221148.1 hypothetical protein TWF106_006473 [Orbilia oligospora]